MAELDAAGLLVAPGSPQPQPMEYADLGRLTYLSWVCKVCRSSIPPIFSGHHVRFLTVFPI